MSLNLPKVFVKHFYACASLLGAVTAYLIHIHFSTLTATIVGALVVIALRMLAYYLRWTLPKPKYQLEKN